MKTLILIIVSILAACAAILLSGCALVKSNTHSLTHITTNGVQIVEQDTHAVGITFFDANSSLTKFRNGSAQTTWGSNSIAPGTWSQGLNESSSSSNLVNGAAQITAAGVAAFVQSAK
jgi:hypothetical protein